MASEVTEKEKNRTKEDFICFIPVSQTYSFVFQLTNFNNKIDLTEDQQYQILPLECSEKVDSRFKNVVPYKVCNSL